MNKKEEKYFDLESKFVNIIQEYIEHKNKYGSILLPTEVILDGALYRAMIKTGIKKPPKEISIIGEHGN